MLDPWAWLESLPSITRVWFCASVAVYVGVSLDFLDPDDLYFDPDRISSKLELWRVLTCFLYGGGVLTDLHVLLSLYMITVHSTSYEKNPAHSGGTPHSDYAFCLIFCSTTTLITFLLLEHTHLYLYHQPQHYLYPLFAQTLVTCILYLWSRRNPNANIQFILIPLSGRYLPFANLALQLAMQNPVSQLVHGMLVGHIFYYCIEVVPAVAGRRVVTTPRILIDGANHLFGVQHEYRPDAIQLQRRQQPPPRPRERTGIDGPTRRRFQADGATEAHIAAKMGQLDRLRRLAQTDPTNMGAKDNNDWQPLHEAVRGGHTEIVIFLMQFESIVDKDARTLQGRGPNALWMAEDFHGLDHPVTKRLQRAGATKLGPEE